MAFLDFNDKLSVKIGIIDEQHKVLINIMNDLHEAMSAGKGKLAIYDTLARLIDYTKMHFAMEQRLMTQYVYPERKIHEIQHQELVKQVDELDQKVKAGRGTVTIETMTFLKSWLNNHILQTDRKFGDYLVSKGVQ